MNRNRPPANGGGPAKTQRSQRNKDPRYKVLLAAERPPVAAVPEAVRVTAAAEEPPVVPNVLNAEQLEAAAGNRDGLHGHEDPLPVRLIGVLKPHLRTDFGRAELQAQGERFLVDLRSGGAVGEAQLGDSDDHDVDFRRIRGHFDLLQDVAAPVADAVTRVDQRLTQRPVVRVRAELDRHERRAFDDGQGLGSLGGTLIEELVEYRLELGIALDQLEPLGTTRVLARGIFDHPTHMLRQAWRYRVHFSGSMLVHR